jgi:hypothetical protein
LLFNSPNCGAPIGANKKKPGVAVTPGLEMALIGPSVTNEISQWGNLFPAPVDAGWNIPHGYVFECRFAAMKA